MNIDKFQPETEFISFVELQKNDDTGEDEYQRADEITGYDFMQINNY